MKVNILILVFILLGQLSCQSKSNKKINPKELTKLEYSVEKKNCDIQQAYDISFHDYILSIGINGNSYVSIKEKDSGNYGDWKYVDFDFEYFSSTNKGLSIFYDSLNKDYFIIFKSFSEEGSIVSIFRFIANTLRFEGLWTHNMDSLIKILEDNSSFWNQAEPKLFKAEQKVIFEYSMIGTDYNLKLDHLIQKEQSDITFNERDVSLLNACFKDKPLASIKISDKWKGTPILLSLPYEKKLTCFKS